jgi:MscS family membrane protein
MWTTWIARAAEALPPRITAMAVTAVAVVVVDRVVQFGFHRASILATRTATGWDDALLAALRRPSRWGLWALALGVIVHVPHSPVPPDWTDELLLLRNLGLVGCAAWFVLGAVGRLAPVWVVQAESAGREPDTTTVDAVVKLVRLVTVVVAALFGAQALGLDLTGLLALGGLGGLTVGFAAKDMLANFVGGLTIYLDRPFVVGEWIRSPDNEIEGTVEHISWRHTRIRGFNKNPIYVPNALFTTIVLENPSRMSHRRIEETVGLRYEDLPQVEAIVDAIRAMLRAHDGIDATQTLIVGFTRYSASSLDLLLYAFTKTTDWAAFQAVKQDVLLRVGHLVEAHGAAFAFPTQTVQLVSPPAGASDSIRKPDGPAGPGP